MKKDQFVAAVAKAANLTAAQVTAALKGIENVAAAQIKEHGEARVPGLVTFKRHELGERIRRMPGKDSEFVAPATVLVKAKPVPAFGNRIKAENTPR